MKSTTKTKQTIPSDSSDSSDSTLHFTSLRDQHALCFTFVNAMITLFTVQSGIVSSRNSIQQSTDRMDPALKQMNKDNKYRMTPSHRFNFALRLLLPLRVRLCCQPFNQLMVNDINVKLVKLVKSLLSCVGLKLFPQFFSPRPEEQDSCSLVLCSNVYSNAAANLCDASRADKVDNFLSYWRVATKTLSQSIRTINAMK